MFSVVRGGFKPLDNFAATTPPDVGNDITQGYSVGSQWLNTTTGVRWFCRDASSGAAVWEPDSAHPGYLTGRAYPIFEGNTATNNISSSNVFHAMCFVPECDMSVLEVSAWLVVGSAATEAKIAIYANKYSGTGVARAFGAPLVATETGQATTATGAKVTWPAVVSLKKGVAYWPCFRANSSTPTFMCAGTTSSAGTRLWGKTDPTATNVLCVTTPLSYAAAWPTLNGSEVWTDYSTIPVLNLET